MHSVLMLAGDSFMSNAYFGVGIRIQLPTFVSEYPNCWRKVICFLLVLQTNKSWLQF